MPEIPSSAVQPTKGGGGSAILKNLLPLLPGIAGAIKNPESLSAFMEGYQRTMAMLEGQDREREELTTRQQDREQVLTRQTAQDRIAAEDRARRQALENVSIGPKLAEAGAMMESPQGAESAIDALYQQLQGGGMFGDLSGSRDLAIRQATQMITAKQKRQMGEFVDAALKVEYVANNPDADPELTALPEHVAKMIGKPSARLSELQRFAQLPVGKPAKTPVRDPIDEYRQRKMIDREFAQPEKPTKVGYRWIKDRDGNVVEWPDNQPAPRGSRPYDAVAERPSSATGIGAPNAEMRAQSVVFSDVKKAADRIINLGDKNNWPGVGGFGKGTISGMVMKNTGKGSDVGQTLRGEIGQIKAAIAKMRGGTSFTANEEKLLDTYTPSVDDHPNVIKNKLNGLKQFITEHEGSVQEVFGGIKPAASHDTGDTIQVGEFSVKKK